MTRDTVVVPTPASLATSLRVGGVFLLIICECHVNPLPQEKSIARKTKCTTAEGRPLPRQRSKEKAVAKAQAAPALFSKLACSRWLPTFRPRAPPTANPRQRPVVRDRHCSKAEIPIHAAPSGWPLPHLPRGPSEGAVRLRHGTARHSDLSAESMPPAAPRRG